MVVIPFLIVTLGAWGYLSSAQVPWGFTWLAETFWLALGIGAVYTFICWRGRQAHWMTVPSTGWPE